jgi:hypothetical protein
MKNTKRKILFRRTKNVLIALMRKRYKVLVFKSEKILTLNRRNKESKTEEDRFFNDFRRSELSK